MEISLKPNFIDIETMKAHITIDDPLITMKISDDTVKEIIQGLFGGSNECKCCDCDVPEEEIFFGVPTDKCACKCECETNNKEDKDLIKTWIKELEKSLKDL